MRTVSDRYLWLTMLLLGCYHGINPGMGWLFAVALGLQEKSAKAVIRAIAPITLGHVLSVVIVVVLTLAAAAWFSQTTVHRTAAGLLLIFGLYRLVRSRHPRWVGMRVGFWGLSLWGFLMASAHGAGLMLAPFVTAMPVNHHDGMTMSMPPAPPAPNYATGALFIAIHTLGYLVTMMVVALVVYWKLGVSFLRSAWINVDLVWAVALIAVGLIALFI